MIKSIFPYIRRSTPKYEAQFKRMVLRCTTLGGGRMIGLDMEKKREPRYRVYRLR